MKRIWTFLRSLDWRVLFAVPVLSVLLGVANNLRVSEDQRVRWSGERADDERAEEEKAEARRGEWTSDFNAATNAAADAHVPVVVVVTQGGCPYCARLQKALRGVAVRSWQKERGWYFVLVGRDNCPQAAEFVVSTPVTNTAAPYVGVYWTRADGTQEMKNFPGRPGRMGVRGVKSLALEWMHAIEASVPGAPGLDGNVSADSIMREAKMRLAVASEKGKGADGRVAISPSVTFLKDWQKAKLTAKPARGSVFVGWRYPNGRFLLGRPELKVDSTWPEGTYTAVFRRPENSAAPVLKLPEQEVTWTELEREKLTLRVNVDAYPVTFYCRGLPPGVFLTSRSEGIVSGIPRSNGVWRVEVMAKVASPAVPAAKGSFTIRVLPTKYQDVTDDDDDGADKDNKVD